MKTFFLLLITTLGLSAQVPAPDTVIFGNVRTATGLIIDDPDFSTIVVKANGVTVGSSPLTPSVNPVLDENYRISISNTNIPSMAIFTVVLVRDSTEFNLIEQTSGSFIFTPIAAALNRFDFIEGNDVDSDGLADDWEMVQLAEIGETDLSLLTADGDFDFDGLSDRDEFITGTFATVFTSQVNFKVNGTVTGEWVSISFDTVANRSYQLLASTDGSNFTPVDMAVNDVRTNLISSYEETSDQRITVTTAPVVGEGVFYRVAIR